MRLARREALWAIKALRDEPLPLFAAAHSRLMKKAEGPNLAPMKDARPGLKALGQI